MLVARECLVDGIPEGDSLQVSFLTPEQNTSAGKAMKMNKPYFTWVASEFEKIMDAGRRLRIQSLVWV